MIYIVSLYWYTLVGCHITLSSYHLHIIFQWLININSCHTLVRLMLSCYFYISWFISPFTLSVWDTANYRCDYPKSVIFLCSHTIEQLEPHHDVDLNEMTRTLSNRAIDKFAEHNHCKSILTPTDHHCRYFVWMLVNRCNLCLPMLILSLYRASVGVRKDWWSWFVAYLQLLSFNR